MIAQLFPILCGLASVSFLACARRLAQAWFWLLGFVATQLLIGPWFGRPLLAANDPQEIAVIITVFAFTILHEHAWRRLAMCMAGLMAAFWLNSLAGLGLPVTMGVLMVAALSGFSLWAVLKRPGFTSDDLLDEAFTLVMVLALLVALVPAVLQGWQSAASLQSLDSGGGADELSQVTMLLAFAAVALGAVTKLIQRSRVNRIKR